MKEKVHDFKEAIDESSVVSDSHPSYQDYNLDSDKTKKAEKFIKKIEKEKAEFQQKKKEKEEKQKDLEVRSMEERLLFENELKKEKKKYLQRKLAGK